MRTLPASARFVASGADIPAKLLLLDVMDTLVADPFFRGFSADLFAIPTVKELFAVKDQASFVAFETGEIDEAEHFATYFTDRRAVDGAAITEYLERRYEWLPGMRELCADLAAAHVPMATFSNYPAPWAPLVESAVGLSALVPWAFVSGEAGVRKPSPQAFEAALALVGRPASEVVFVDDSAANCEAARALGIPTVRFEGADALRAALRDDFAIAC